MATAQGKIVRQGTTDAIAGAIITLKRKGEKDRTAKSDAAGNFEFQDLSNATYTLSAWKEDNLSGKETIDLENDQLNLQIELDPQRDEKAGKGFFKWLLAALGILIILYLVLHLVLPQGTLSLSKNLDALIIKIEQPLKDSADPGKDLLLTALLGDLADGVKGVAEDTPKLKTEDKALAILAADKLTEAVEANDKKLLLERFFLLKELVQKPSQSRFSIWTEDPLRLLEIMMWGLAGILVSKIITIGWYLYQHRYYRSGIWMHLSHLFATPILVLVTTLLLSIATFNITLSGGTELNIDLSDPNTMIVFAFIIGTSPWPLWRFIQDTASNFTKRSEDND